MHEWKNISSLVSKQYTCGHCGNPVASEKGYHGPSIGADGSRWIYICHFCLKPTFFDEREVQVAGAVFGNPVEDIPDTLIKSLYDEARRATSANAYTAAILSCRKILMHIAVSKGAKQGDSFVNYVRFLADQHFIPPEAID